MKCARRVCNCPTTDGTYCGEECARMATDGGPDGICGCGHLGCGPSDTVGFGIGTAGTGHP